MGKLSASILAADLARLADQVKLVEKSADVFHVDIMDGHFVPPIALGTVVVESLRPVTDRTLHGHLMVDAPEGFFDELREAGLDMVSFHLEAVPEPGPAIRKARDAGLGVGLTLNLETPVAGRLPLPGGDRRSDAHEHQARLVRAAAQPRGVRTPRRGPSRDRPPRARPPTSRSTAGSSSRTRSGPWTPAPTC